MWRKLHLLTSYQPAVLDPSGKGYVELKPELMEQIPEEARELCFGKAFIIERTFLHYQLEAHLTKNRALAKQYGNDWKRGELAGVSDG